MSTERQMRCGSSALSFAHRWLNYVRDANASRAPLSSSSLPDHGFEAVEQLDQLVRTNPDDAWLVIVEILHGARSESELAALAAGPLEDILVKHGDRVVDRLEQLTSVDAKFREALFAVWKNEISDDVWSRVEKARSLE